jgi:hypothetical protein
MQISSSSSSSSYGHHSPMIVSLLGVRKINKIKNKK